MSGNGATIGSSKSANPRDGANPAKGAATSGMMLAGAVVMLALPSAVLAFATVSTPQALEKPSEQAIESFDSANAPVRLARAIPLRSLGEDQMFPFTPAKTSIRPDRSVTVAVRVDPVVVRGIKLPGPGDVRIADAGSSSLRIAPTAFNLGVSRGYRGFAQNLVSPSENRSGEMPDIEKFKLVPGAQPDESRFSPRIVLDASQAAGRAPRTFGGEREDRVDVGGSYRVTRNLDVTAGVRYAQDQTDRLRPLTDGQQDNQAVYVGTQFRF